MATRKTKQKVPARPPALIMRICEEMRDALSDQYPDGSLHGNVDIAVGSIDDINKGKLPVLARDRLRAELRTHPEARRHITVEAIDQMAKRELLALAKKLGIDSDTIIAQSINRGKGMAAVLEEEELQRWERFCSHPGFVGSLEFDISISLLGRRVKRRARVEYRLTPEWPYWDPEKGQSYVGWPGSIMSIHILAVPDADDADPQEPQWVEMPEFAQDDVLPAKVWETLRDTVEEHCKREDAERRRIAAAKATSPAKTSRRRH